MARGSGPSRIVKPKSKSNRGPTKPKVARPRSAPKRKRAADTTEDSEERSDRSVERDEEVAPRRNRRKKAKPWNIESAEEITGASKTKGKQKQRAVVEEVDEEEPEDDMEPEVVEGDPEEDETEEEVSCIFDSGRFYDSPCCTHRTSTSTRPGKFLQQSLPRRTRHAIS
jgi:hypothetical protein